MAFVYVGIGGFLGSCLRYLFTLMCKNIGVLVPLGTLISNVLAGILIGFVIGMDRRANRLKNDRKDVSVFKWFNYI